MPITKAGSAVVVGCIALGLAGCGSASVGHVAAGQSSTAPTTSTTAPGATTTAGPAAPTATTAPAQVPPGWKPVSFGNVRFAVPAAWPVYDLRTDPSRCVRFDQHAVYLGHVGPHPQCPATVVGKTDAVHVEPYDSQSQSQLVTPTPTTVAGQPALTDPASATTRNIVVALQSSGVLVTLTFTADPSLDQSILATFQSTTG